MLTKAELETKIKELESELRANKEEKAKLELAKPMRDMYESYLANGFNKEQSFTLLIETIRASKK